jgi:uncharacterized protein YggE
MEVEMGTSSRCAAFAVRFAFLRRLSGGVTFAAAIFVATMQAQAQQPQSRPDARVVVTGEGSISVPPDYGRIRAGVTTRAKTAKEATEANTRLMTAVIAALRDAGVEQKDIQTSQFSVFPVYAPREPNTEPKLSGFSASSQLGVTIRQLASAGAILDRLITAGANDIGNVEFLHADTSKKLDAAREAAIADARRKAEVYARAAGLALGRVVWITEDSGYAPPVEMKMMRAASLAASPVPVSAGEDTLQVRITVGFDAGP